MKTTKYLVHILLIMIFLFAACAKEGPAGPQGETGLRGAKGEKGEKGDRGTANVYYSDWIKVDFEGSFPTFRATIKAPKITQEILDHATVIVYFDGSFNHDRNTNIIKLNYNDGSYIVTYHLALKKIWIVSSFDFSDFPFRYMIIPGGVHLRQSPHPDFNDYAATCAYYGIAE